MCFARTVGIHGDKPVAIGRRVHPGVPLFLPSITAGTVKVQDHGQRACAGGLWRYVNDIASAKPAVVDIDTLVARSERFGARSRVRDLE